MKGGIIKMLCRNCKHFILHEDLFGYCKKYDEQALISENCKEIKEKMPDDRL